MASDIPGRNAYSYALSLMDILFSKQEMSQRCFLNSNKRKRPLLHNECVDLLLKIVEAKYGDNWVFSPSARNAIGSAITFSQEGRNNLAIYHCVIVSHSCD